MKAVFLNMQCPVVEDGGGFLRNTRCAENEDRNGGEEGMDWPHGLVE
jgi:hypothetical protein